MNNKISDLIDEVVNIRMESIKQDLDESIRYTNTKMKKEAVNMYKSFIDEFYEYETSSYIRHGELRPGSREGNNLYNSMDIRSNSRNNKLSIYLPFDLGYENHMEGGYRIDQDPSMVAFLVTEGIRFPYRNSKNNNFNPYWQIRKGYRGNYFKFNNGTIREAFDLFNNEFDYIAEKIIYEQMKRKGYK